MTDGERDDEARLRELFDATVEPPSGPLLVRMAARSKDVPGRARRTWWRPLGFSLAAALAGALLVSIDARPPAPLTAASSAASVFGDLQHAVRDAERTEIERENVEALAAQPDDDTEAALAGLGPDLDLGLDDELGLGLLDDADEDEAWLDSTSDPEEDG